MTVETWNREVPPGFQGLNPDIPVTFYYRHLPHWRQDGATYFVTFRLADSLPQAKWLDQGTGSCHLKRADIASVVADALHHFDDQTYELGAYVVMPNHVHAIMRPLAPRTDPLEKILQSRKLRTSREINSILGESGTLWQDESFDRIIRDAEHLYRCLQYIGKNPRYAGLAPEECLCWVRPAWHNLGWTFES